MPTIYLHIYEIIHISLMLHKLTVLTLVPSFVPVLCGFCGMSSRCVAQAADVFASSRHGISGAGTAVSAAMPRLIGIFRGINSIAFNNAKHSAKSQRDTENLFHYRAWYILYL